MHKQSNIAKPWSHAAGLKTKNNTNMNVKDGIYF